MTAGIASWEPPPGPCKLPPAVWTVDSASNIGNPRLRSLRWRLGSGVRKSLGSVAVVLRQ